MVFCRRHAIVLAALMLLAAGPAISDGEAQPACDLACIKKCFCWKNRDTADQMIRRTLDADGDPAHVEFLETLRTAIDRPIEEMMLRFLDAAQSGHLGPSETSELYELIERYSRERHAAEGAEPGLIAPKALTLFRLDYPEQARKRRINGEVILLARIETDGHVGSIYVVKTDGEAFTAEATKKMRAMRYTPAMRDGEPVPFGFTMRCTFKSQ